MSNVAGFWTARRLALALFVALATMAVFRGLSPGLADRDWWWHLETGRLILREGVIPAVDPFSWTFEGQPWVLQSWLFQAALAALWEVGGEGAVAVATAVSLGLIWWVAYATADRLVRRPVLTLLVALLLGAGIVSSGAPRPHLVSLLIFALYLSAFADAKYGRRRWPLLALPLLMVVWVNCHGAFVLGVATVLAFAVLESAQLLMGRRDPRQVSLLLWLWAMAVATVAATGVNPWGFAHWLYPFSVLGMDLVGEVVEWQSIMTSPLRGPWFAAGGILFFLVLARAPQRPDLTEMLFPAALFAAGLMQARHAPFASIAMLVFAAPSLWRDRADQVVLPGAVRVVGWGIAALGFVVPVLLARGPYPEAVRQVMPSDIVAFVEETRPPGRMFNEYGIGGYLIHRLGATAPVFIDSRADLYGDDFYRAYSHTLSAAAPLALHFDSWGIGYAIVRAQHAMTRVLLLRGWRVAFRGRTHVVLLPPER